MNQPTQIIFLGSPIFENPKDGGQAPYEIYKKALNNGYKLYGRVATIACLIKI